MGQLNDEEQQLIKAKLSEALNNGRALHERYANYATLYANKTLNKFIANLTFEYKGWLDEAVEMMPNKLKSLRLGRIFVYAVILAALSPSIKLPVNLKSKYDLILFLLPSGNKKRISTFVEILIKKRSGRDSNPRPPA